MKVRGFEYCNEEYIGTISLPLKGTSQSAGYDYFCPHEVIVMPGQTEKIVTGIKAYMQPGEVLILFPRSSNGIKHNIVLANTVGVVDADYYNNPHNGGNIIIVIRNNGNHPLKIGVGERFAQGVFFPFLSADNTETLYKERIGGVGSTAK